jgi:serine/threonine protein kinase
VSIDRSGEHAVTAPSRAPEPAGESALRPGARIHEFRILKLIGEGGFGIVYLAHDESLDRTVALKEYMPSQLAERSAGTMGVQVRSHRYAETFAAGMRSFINEARLLARFDHPSLLKVYRFFQANGTAYMAMPFYEGHTLKAVLRAMTGPPSEAWLRRLLYPVLDGLEVIHKHDCYHRDIAPDNILIQNDTPILLDFGAARRVIGDITRTLTVILKPGYAPIEQYGEDPNLRQGAWTDIYALAGVVHFALTRQAPPASIARAMGDQLVPLSQRLRGIYSDAFLRAFDAALAVRPQDRPQSVAELRAMLLDSEPSGAAAYAPLTSDVPVEAVPQSESMGVPRDAPPGGARETPAAYIDLGGSGKRATLAALALAIPAAAAAVWWVTARTGEPPAQGRAPVMEQATTAPPAAERATASPAAQPAREAAPQPSVTSAAPPPPVTDVPQAKPSERPKAAAAPEPKPVPARVAEAPRSAPAAQPARAEPQPPAKSANPRTERQAAPPAPVKSEPVRPALTEMPKPPPQFARLEPSPESAPALRPEAAPAAKPEAARAAAGAAPASSTPPARAETPKAPVEVARVDTRPAAPPSPRPPALVGRYTGKLMTDGSPVPITLQILSVENGAVSATAKHGTGRCEGDYRMTGTVHDDALRMRSTHSSGRYGDCSFGFKVSVQGTKLVGQTSAGAPLELSR